MANFTKEQLKKMDEAELNKILISGGYKKKGLKAFKTKADKISAILTLNEPAPKPDDKGDDKGDDEGDWPEGKKFTEEQIAAFTTVCTVIGEPDVDNRHCQACKTESAAKKQVDGGYYLDQHDYCAQIAKAKAEAGDAKKSRRDASGPTTRMKSKYNDFPDLQNHLQNLPIGHTFTMALNQALLGKHTVAELLEVCEELQSTIFKDNNDMKNVSTIRRHLTYLTHRGWVIVEDDKKVVQLTDYRQGVKLPFPFVEPEEDKKKAA